MTQTEEEKAKANKAKAEADAKAKAKADAKAKAEADAKAKAEADAKAKAKAEADAKAKAKAEADAQAKENLARLPKLIEKTAVRGGRRLEDLLADLEENDGLEVVKAKGAEPDYIWMAGVKTRVLKDRAVMLDNWSHAARRALLQAA